MATESTTQTVPHLNSSSIFSMSSINGSLTSIEFTVSSSTAVPKANITSSMHSLDLSSTSTASFNTTTELNTSHGHPSSAAAIGIFVIVMGVAVFGALLFMFIRRKRNLSYLPFPCDKLCMPGRKRHNSHSSFNNPLTTADDTDHVIPRERELFSIGDQDGGSDGRVRTRGPRVEADDDYFYDEIFERSEFTDERTNKSNKQLTVEDFEDEFDIPDLTFRPSSKFKMT